MKIYIASKFCYALLAQYIARDLEEDGHEITYKWFIPALAVKASAQNINDKRTQAVAQLERQGVLGADAVLHLVDDVGGTGSFVECGIAFARGIPVYAISARGDAQPPYRSIFDTLYAGYLSGVAAFKAELVELNTRGRST